MEPRGLRIESEPGNAVLVAPRGYAFSAMILFVAVFGFFGVVFLVGAVSDPSVAWAPIVFGVIATLGVAGVLYYRDERRLELDSKGVRFFRGEKIRSNIPWGAVTRVRYGTRVTVMGRRSVIVHFLEVRGSRFRDRIDFDGSSYRIPESAVAVFSEKVVQDAQVRGIPVQHKQIKRGLRK